MNSITSQETAALAAKRILGFYPEIPASDPKAFAAGLVQTLMTFPEAVVQLAMDPVRGIPAKVKYPNLAAMREHLDRWRVEHLDYQERLERAQRKRLPEPKRDPEHDKRMYEGFKQLSAHLEKGFGPSVVE
jgi:hypothetical protein